MTFNPVPLQNIIGCKKIIKENNPNAIDFGSQI